MLPLASLYTFVLFIHIGAVVIGFGVIFTYPLLNVWVRSRPHLEPSYRAIQAELSNKVIAPGMVVILLAGGYLAGKIDAFGEFWVLFPLVSIFIIGGIGGAYLGPREAKAAELLAERDVSSGGRRSDELQTVLKEVDTTQLALAVYVLVVIFVMTVKPFA